MTISPTLKINVHLYVVVILMSVGCREPRATKEEMLKDLSPDMQTIVAPGIGDSLTSTPMLVAGVEEPRMVLPADESLLNEEEVVGVVVHGQARAYPLSRMRGMLEHVVNDVVLGVIEQGNALTVTYCDMSDCVRVFAADGDSETVSLQMGTVGLIGGALAVSYQDQHYRQTDEIPGLQSVPFVRTTWAEWRNAHPETLVYAGSSRTDTIEPDAKH